ncbi:ergothioneine biosynthesis protein EgtB, partial [Fulvivirga lutimaris]|uniref:ergothioneine biosynthesis protein EgtB n=1 Tax=Fulvivirga lutimaris TaxID=1819566 RepID=UPI001FE7471E
LLSKFKQVRLQSEKICKPLKTEDYVVQPIVDVSPPKWHLGHTTWFFETFILVPFFKDYTLFNSDYGYLFNSYYETVGARVIRTDRGNITRPGVQEVLAYRAYIDEHMEIFLNGGVTSEVNNLLELGLQHEQQHQELLIYDIKYILGNNPLFPAYQNIIETDKHEAKSLGWLNIEEGTYKIGFDKEGFSFDNEHGVHQVFLHEYAIADRLITNSEYLEFMEDGGYSNFRHWLSDAWEWVKTNEIKAPEHWHFQDGKWHQYNLSGGLQPVNLDAPVTHISFYEADAFAKWKGLRLPTEFEWEVACLHYGNLEMANGFSDNGVFEPQASTDNQFFGEVWEWTASAYRPYPYYQAPEGAVGEYNGKFMVNQMVLRGGSCATPKDHIRATYRNFFHPHLRWMFSGLRLAKHL